MRLTFSSVTCKAPSRRTTTSWPGGSQMALESQTAQTNALIVGQAAPPVHPASPKPLLVMATVSVIGLLAGLLLAFLRERCDQRIRTNEQAVALLQQPLIALLPHFGGTASKANCPASQRRREGVSAA